MLSDSWCQGHIDIEVILFLGHINLLLQEQILHRDVSLSNIMYDADGGSGNMGRLIDLNMVKVIKFPPVLMTEGDLRTVSLTLVVF